MTGISGRVAKPLVHTALDKAAENLKAARGNDPNVSRADVKVAAKAIASDAERALTEQFFRFIDAREPALGARVTDKDIDKAVAYAKKHIVDKYDVNGNGISKEEIGKMSRLGRLAVDFAIELKKTGAAGTTPTALATTQLGTDITAAALLKDGSVVNYISESDYPVLFVAAPAPAAFTAAAVTSAFAAHLLSGVFKGERDLTSMTAEMESPAESRDRLERMAEIDDPQDPASVEIGAAFGKVKKLLDDNLSDLRIVKVGPKGSDGSLSEDNGLYNYFVVGKTRDGQIAGVSFGSVET